MEKKDCKFYKINERLTVTVDHGNVYVKRKESRASEKKGDRCPIDDVDLLPKLAKDNISAIREAAASKAFRYISCGIKNLPSLVDDSDFSILRVDSISFEFTFSAWFCEREGNDEIVSYSVCSMLDKYNKREGMNIAFKRLKIGICILQNGKDGKVYDLEKIEKGTENVHGRCVKGIITDEGINIIRC